MILLLIQSCCMGSLFLVHRSNALQRLEFFYMGMGMVIWLFILMVFTALLWYRGNTRTFKQDLGAIAVVTVLTLFSVAGLVWQFFI